MKIRNEIITSRRNPTVVRAALLSEKKHRDAYGLFRTDGVKLAGELFSRGIIPELVLLRESKAEGILGALGATPDCDAVVLADGVFDKVSEEKSPEGIICIVKHLDNFRKIDTINNNGKNCDEWSRGRILVLESVRDPGNLGTVIRSAAAFGCDRIIISPDCADVFSPKTVRASMGALFTVGIDRVDSLPRAVDILTSMSRKVYAAALDREAVGLDRLAVGDDCVFAVGNEGHGLSAEVVDRCTGKVFIPMTENAESLNAAVAASVLLWEMKRRNG